MESMKKCRTYRQLLWEMFERTYEKLDDSVGSREEMWIMCSKIVNKIDWKIYPKLKWKHQLRTI